MFPPKMVPPGKSLGECHVWDNEKWLSSSRDELGNDSVLGVKKNAIYSFDEMKNNSCKQLRYMVFKSLGKDGKYYV